MGNYDTSTPDVDYVDSRSSQKEIKALRRRRSELERKLLDLMDDERLADYVANETEQELAEVNAQLIELEGSGGPWPTSGGW